MAKVTVVDFGTGNLLSVTRALNHVLDSVEVTDDPARVAAAERLVVPGVGAFGDVMGSLVDQGLADPIRRFAETGRPWLGICVGMQVMMEAGEEFGDCPGLGLLPGRVAAIPAQRGDGGHRKIPHIGWNGLQPAADWSGSVLDGLAAGSAVYFVHSFSVRPQDRSHVLAVVDHDGVEVVAALRHGNLFGCQFHPEKSGPLGLQILGNFARL